MNPFSLPASKSFALSTFLLLIIIALTEPGRAGGGSAASVDAVRRLDPSVFGDLPLAVAADLRERGCSVPQTYMSAEPHNVIRGQLRTPGQLDWAVLCSRDQSSSILVYWTGSVAHVEELAGPVPDADWMQDLGDGEMGFSRTISAVDEAHILSHYHAYGGPKPPSIDHQGINHAFIEKASTVLYWHRGEWLGLTGAD